MIAIAIGVSGCSTTGSPLLGSSQRYAYAAPQMNLTSAMPSAATPTPIPASAGAAARAVTDLPTTAELPVYDETKDPYVTAVLLPPADSKEFEDEIGPDGKRIVLAPIATLDVIDVRDGHKALVAANPE
ncbi:hypothetical protein [Aureimonas leprariae]|uniref:Uncharacterized protein n=1 Tax=Plantimonas leprariae TaxID=2615207 RepID=A0A7V7PSD0_9HYPH|nr:hypothetical protein [Aureimonas leprariae]KAB0682034.1 hypothetical protein F6X38_04325 [Aureimonas leprariae]